MAQFFRTLGRFAGQAIRSHAFDKAVTVMAGYVVSEMRLIDLKAKRTILKRKHTNHINLLGRTVYSLIINDINPVSENHILNIVRVLGEIEQEIAVVEEEMERRRKMDIEKRKNKESNFQKTGN
jgi:hypothetical protein